MSGWNDVPAATRDVLLTAKGEELHAHALRFKMPVETLKRRLRDHRTAKAFQAALEAGNVPIPESPRPRIEPFMELQSDDCMMIGDLEIPDVDPLFIQLVIMTAVKFGIKKLIIGGDTVNGDENALATHDKVVQLPGDRTLRQNQNQVAKLLQLLGYWFEQIFIISGNHDEHMARATGGELTLDMLLKDTKAEFSYYRYMYVYSRRGPIYVGHPQQYSSNSIGLAQKMYNVTLSPTGEKCHMVIFHTHQPQSGLSPDGLRECYAVGCGRDKDRTVYKMLGSNAYPEWGQSFLMLRRGFFTHFVVKATDWELVLGEKLYSQSRLAKEKTLT